MQLPSPNAALSRQSPASCRSLTYPHPLSTTTPLRPIPAYHLPPPLRRLLAPLLSQEPAAQLIRSTALSDWGEPGLASP